MKRCPELFQIEATECGAVSLGMVMEYHGVIVPPEELRDACQVSRDGSRASELVKTARRFGFDARGFRVNNPDDILKYKLPAILYWDFCHFLVCCGKKGGDWILNDPASGRRTVTSEEMDRSFTGVLLQSRPRRE